MFFISKPYLNARPNRDKKIEQLLVVSYTTIRVTQI